MKVVLFGKNGQLGRELQPVLAPFGQVLALGHQDLISRICLRWKHSSVCINHR